jgi:DNA polymerase
MKKRSTEIYTKPDFEILLFDTRWTRAAADRGLGAGETLPQWLAAALTDRVHKTPYIPRLNRLLVQILGPLPLEQWRCTMLHDLSGYTAGLEATVKRWGLPDDKQKLSTGKALYQFLRTCAPQRQRRPHTQPAQHDPERWELFREYSLGEMATEMEILRRLSNYPLPDSEQSSADDL